MDLNLIKKEKLALVSSLFGNVVEFYDFMVFIFLLKYIAANFFPDSCGINGTLKIFSVSIGAYFARPLGALFFGKIGDQSGRKPALLYSIFIASIATTCVGVLPTFSSIGIYASLLLVFLRVLQGFSVSGEQGGAAVFLRELLGKKNGCFAGALIVTSIFSGILLGAFVCYIIAKILSDPVMYDWGWRIPFLLAFPLGVISYCLRKQTKESPVFEQLRIQCAISKNPIKELFTKYWINVLALILIGSLYAIITSTYMVFIPNYLTMQKTWDYANTMLFLTSGLAFMIILIPFCGIIADKIGAIKVIKIGAVCTIFLSIPAIKGILSKTFFGLCLGQGIFVLLVSLIAAPIFSIIVDVFPFVPVCL